MSDSTEREAWYDTEIAPALLALGKRCEEKGMAFIAVVEYEPNKRGGTYFVPTEAGLEMSMIRLASATAPNVDAYIIHLKRHCKELGIDASSSWVLSK